MIEALTVHTIFSWWDVLILFIVVLVALVAARYVPRGRP